MSKRSRNVGVDEVPGYSPTPTEHLIGIREEPFASLGLYLLVREGFLLDRVMGMVSSSKLFDSRGVLTRIIGNSGRSMKRQRSSGCVVRLDARQSTIAFQYAHALEYTLKVFGSPQAAEDWLGRPCKYLADQVPLDMIECWYGFQAVKDYLERIELGIYQ